MTTVVPAIRRGTRVVDGDGDLATVSHVNQSKGTVHLKTDGGESYTMELRELRRALVDGDYAIAEEELDADEDPDDEDAEDDF
jgi:hypothetical protein